MVIQLSQNRVAELNKLFCGDQVFFKLGVAGHDGFPLDLVPEVCFAGRSNVGKSSLINALTNRSGLARASNTPGRTQELNYFAISRELNLVDLPGYGFAEAPKKKVNLWNALIRDYLRGRNQLRRAFILIDSRHGVKDIDKEIFKMLDGCGINYQIILTKIDKISQLELEEVQEKTHAVLSKFIAVHPRFLTTSSEKKIGIHEVQHEIANFIPQYYVPEDNKED